MYKRIFAAIDGSASAQLALEEAVRLAQAADATVTAVCVVQHTTRLSDLGPVFVDEQQIHAVATDAVTETLKDADECFQQAQVRGVARAIDARGEEIASVLSRAADECEADLVVMGTHGRRGWRRMLMGSVAESLVRLTHLPVLLVRHDPDIKPIPSGL
ncbi:universal stress protein [Paraburkholderia sp. BL10I2N1]|uniref:universal stress protein n=1 Tax=Paraburkholderia sp. BL10I2N1 TaxID=1938796 RepID=UPI00105EB929|nr:universal stress protein [Paraburkholderia sp. BL10I2N1]TDN61972.1 nucleotide-binding universal stress UspA family protein [Paraburkholderia sp. BL10I2N1]